MRMWKLLAVGNQNDEKNVIRDSESSIHKCSCVEYRHAQIQQPRDDGCHDRPLACPGEVKSTSPVQQWVGAGPANTAQPFNLIRRLSLVVREHQVYGSVQVVMEIIHTLENNWTRCPSFSTRTPTMKTEEPYPSTLTCTHVKVFKRLQPSEERFFVGRKHIANNSSNHHKSSCSNHQFGFLFPR
jgi:hypothetical protein